MAVITLEGMRFHAKHGVYEAERLLGTDYIVDVSIETDISLAAETDAIECTVNYETVYQIVRLEMETPMNLIETVVQSIIDKLKRQFGLMQGIKVKVKKLNPPLGGRVEASSVEEEVSFASACPRCGSPLICYQDDNCWCKDITLHPATRESISKQFHSCLCRNCLKFYAG